MKITITSLVIALAGAVVCLTTNSTPAGKLREAAERHHEGPADAYRVFDVEPPEDDPETPTPAFAAAE